MGLSTRPTRFRFPTLIGLVLIAARADADVIGRGTDTGPSAPGRPAAETKNSQIPAGVHSGTGPAPTGDPAATADRPPNVPLRSTADRDAADDRRRGLRNSAGSPGPLDGRARADNSNPVPTSPINPVSSGSRFPVPTGASSPAPIGASSPAPTGVTSPAPLAPAPLGSSPTASGPNAGPDPGSTSARDPGPDSATIGTAASTSPTPAVTSSSATGSTADVGSSLTMPIVRALVAASLQPSIPAPPGPSAGAPANVPTTTTIPMTDPATLPPGLTQADLARAAVTAPAPDPLQALAVAPVVGLIPSVGPGPALLPPAASILRTTDPSTNGNEESSLILPSPVPEPISLGPWALAAAILGLRWAFRSRS